MTPEYWQRIEWLFESALAMPAEARELWLLETCAGDQALRLRVTAMLNGGVASGTLEHAVEEGHSMARSLLESGSPQAGVTRFGSWLVTGVLGKGGMGTVYEAVRDDGSYTQAVALKVMQSGLPGGDMAIRRFRQERNILAALDHPDIARLVDGGEAPVPWLAIEKVVGTPLGTCAVGETLESRLRLFLRVCGAVQYAHSRLVVHRDLKPANILVTRDGVPKLLDFGIAGLLPGKQWTDPGTSLTRTGMMPMTPEYASPEQLQGEPIGVASDVYSLGAVLYNLLTGQPPHRQEGMTAREMEAAVTTTMPSRPSDVASGEIRAKLRGDLDNIVLLALRKEPDRRYGSADALAADIRRHLEGLPVTARAATFSYLASRFVRRHAWGVAAVCAVVISLGAGLGVAARQARIAGERFREVRQLANRFLFEFDDSVRNLPGATRSRELVVRTAQDYLGRLSRDAPGDIALTGELAAAYARLGEIQGYAGAASLGRNADALISYRRSEQLWSEVKSARPRDVTALRSLASVQMNIGLIFIRDEHLDEAGRYYTTSADSWKAALSVAPDDPETIRQAITGWLAIGDYRQSVDDGGGALDAYQQALDFSRRPVDKAAEAKRRNAEAITLSRLGLHYSGLNQPDKARAYHEESLAMRLENLKLTPLVPATRRSVATGYENLGSVFDSTQTLSLGDPAAAEINYRRALDLKHEAAAADPNDNDSRAGGILDAMRLCETLAVVRPADAIPYCREATSATTEGSTAALKEYAALAEIGMARAYLALHRPADAQAAAESALRRLNALPAGANLVGIKLNRVRALNALGSALLAGAQPAKARDTWRAALGVNLGETGEMSYRDLELIIDISGRVAAIDPQGRCGYLKRAVQAQASMRAQNFPVGPPVVVPASCDSK